MDIVDLTDEYLHDYLVCLEDWSDEMNEAGDRKARWYETMRDRGLRVKLAIVDERPIGMIQYLPIEHSIAEGQNLYMILCIWVHGYRQGVGNHQGHGIGTALLEAAEADAARLGADGIAAWGVSLPFWMRAGWFRKHGYRTADRTEGRALLWKPFSLDAQPPHWVEGRPPPDPVPGQVTIAAYTCGWCPANNIVYERAKRVADEMGEKVVFVSHDTLEKADMRSEGHSDDVFLDGKRLQHGPPPSYERIQKRVARQVKRLDD